MSKGEEGAQVAQETVSGQASSGGRWRAAGRRRRRDWKGGMGQVIEGGGRGARVCELSPAGTRSQRKNNKGKRWKDRPGSAHSMERQEERRGPCLTPAVIRACFFPLTEHLTAHFQRSVRLRILGWFLQVLLHFLGYCLLVALTRRLLMVPIAILCPFCFPDNLALVATGPVAQFCRIRPLRPRLPRMDRTWPGRGKVALATLTSYCLKSGAQVWRT